MEVPLTSNALNCSKLSPSPCSYWYCCGSANAFSRKLYGDAFATQARELDSGSYGELESELGKTRLETCNEAVKT
jgi:hypothetical protein